MKKLNDLKKSLPSSARLNIMDKIRVKGGSNNKDEKVIDRPSGNSGWKTNEKGD